MGAREPSPSSSRVAAPASLQLRHAPCGDAASAHSLGRRPACRTTKALSEPAAAAPTAVPGRGLRSSTRARCGTKSRPHSRRRHLIRRRTRLPACAVRKWRAEGLQEPAAGSVLLLGSGRWRGQRRSLCSSQKSSTEAHAWEPTFSGVQ